MTTWVNAESGEVLDADCPRCEDTRVECDIQVSTMERELRGMRSKLTRAERKLEAESIKKRDGASWKLVLGKWMEVFPDKRVTSKGVKSARATAYFLRQDAGATEEDVIDAIYGAKAYPYVVYGKRRQTGSESDLLIDLQDIVSVNNDRNFDFLCEVGRAARQPQEPVF